jgi:hypothetical protein
MKTTLENIKKVVAKSLRNAIKRNNKVEEVGASGSRVKREHDSTNLRAHNMMRGIMEPFVVLIVVKAMPTVVKVTRQTT